MPSPTSNGSATEAAYVGGPSAGPPRETRAKTIFSATTAFATGEPTAHQPNNAQAVSIYIIDNHFGIYVYAVTFNYCVDYVDYADVLVHRTHHEHHHTGYDATDRVDQFSTHIPHNSADDEAHNAENVTTRAHGEHDSQMSKDTDRALVVLINTQPCAQS